MSLSVVWALLKVWGPKLLGFLPSIPREVWIGLALLAFLGYFAHWNAERGRSQLAAEIAAAVAAERLRIEQSDQQAVEAAVDRAIAAERLAALRGKELQSVFNDAAHMPNAGDVCIPGTIADGLRDLR